MHQSWWDLHGQLSKECFDAVLTLDHLPPVLFNGKNGSEGKWVSTSEWGNMGVCREMVGSNGYLV